MKGILLSVLIGAAVLQQSAKAITVTIDSALSDANTFVFDVEWGSGPFEDTASATISRGAVGSGTVSARISGTHMFAFGVFVSPITYTFASGPPLDATVFFDLEGFSLIFDPTTLGQQFNVTSAFPASITPSADHLGAHFVFSALPSAGVPEGGSSGTLLALAIVGVVGLRKMSAG